MVGHPSQNRTSWNTPSLDNFQKQIVFCGDSPNDEPMFNFFQNSVGVANVLDFTDEIQKLPTWITKKRSSEGFVELSDAILESNFI